MEYLLKLSRADGADRTRAADAASIRCATASRTAHVIQVTSRGRNRPAHPPTRSPATPTAPPETCCAPLLAALTFKAEEA